jgi:O-antigen ligase
MKEQPLLGYGVGSFWTTSRRQLYDISDGHNGYLDVLLELGVVGLGLYSAWLLSCARWLHKTLTVDYDWASLAISFLIMTLVFNATESTLSGLAEQLTAVAALSCLVGPYECLCRPSRPTLQSSRYMKLDRLSGTGCNVEGEFATAEEISWGRRSNPDASAYRWAE